MRISDWSSDVCSSDLTMVCYMPTLSLAITVAYNALKQAGLDVIRDYPPIRVWGTIGFIAAMWTTSLLGLETSPGQFYIAAAAALVLGLYAFTLPPAPPLMGQDRKSTRLNSSH